MPLPTSWLGRTLGAVLLSALAAIGLGFVNGQLSGLANASASAALTEGPAPALDGATTWLNSPPLSTAQLRGKVVLIDFWTYSCINCVNTLPYVHAWAKKYKDQGLVVIGVHTPEFPFEKDIGNVRDAIRHFKIDYPVAVDNDYKIWRAFSNNYWPALYFIDANGRIRHQKVGEGDYEKSEQVIQALLREAKGATTPAQPAAQ